MPAVCLNALQSKPSSHTEKRRYSSIRKLLDSSSSAQSEVKLPYVERTGTIFGQVEFSLRLVL
jgi:hypothetical protein